MDHRTIRIALLFGVVSCSGASTDVLTDGSPSDAGLDDAGNGGDSASSGGKSLHGTLGTLGAVKPTVAAFVVSNSGETLIYLSSAPLTCATLQASRWLSGQPAGSQVIELVMKGKPSQGQTVKIPPGEANYAPGGKSSAYETSAASGSFTLTTVAASGAVQGTVSAAYDDGSTVDGSFEAAFCANGQQY